jgi:O-6-methylguanine DNA methyltransferase
MGDVHSAAIAELESPIGPLRILSTESGLAYLELPHANGRGLAGWLARNAPGVRPTLAFAPNRAAAVQVAEYLEGKRERFELPLDLRGTPFQLRVWGELLRIPYGETRSYADVARAIGEPGAPRAVGAANGANPVALVVPCHRVVATHGLGGYGGGLPLKRQLLALERGRMARPEQGRLL